MPASQISIPMPSTSTSRARDRLRDFLDARRRAKDPVEDLEQFERELHTLFAAAEAEAVGDELARFDVDLPGVEIDGMPHRRVLRCEETYMTAAGPARVMRTLYSTRHDGELAVNTVELRAGVVGGFWTPLAAKQGTWVVAHLTPQEGEDLFARVGGMQPSKSSLDRLPKEVSARWEPARLTFEDALRAAEQVPKAATTVAVSLDGVLVPMKDDARQEKRERAAAEGKAACGPAGYQEVGCATVSLYDAEGERLQTIRLARMPEHKKATLKASLMAELNTRLARRPDLTIVGLADGAKDNWSFLDWELPSHSISIADFYHVAEHLHAALVAAYGETDPQCKAQFEKLRHLLRHDRRGAEKVIRALVHLRDRHPRRKKIATELKFFRNNRHRMHYAMWAAKGLPIGSGVTEAACKTLATQRMKRSGMHWRQEGGQAVLTFRAMAQSGRFDRGWALVAATYKHDVVIPENIVSISTARARRQVSM
ncbi:MAG: hypothetical protein ACREMC_02065 [Gemmatimonadales bacterium]